MNDDALAAGSTVIADGIERSIRLAAVAVLLAFFARRPDKSPRTTQIDCERLSRAERGDDPTERPFARDRLRSRWAALLWSMVTLFLLTVVVYTALHGADLLAELDELGLVPGAY